VANILGSIFTPQTEYLHAQAQAIDEQMPELERLQGMAVQEANQNLQQRRREAMRIAGEEGWTSTQMRDYMGRMEQENLAFQNSASADTMQQRAAAQNARRQLELMAGVRGPQEAFDAVKKGVGTAAQIAGNFIPGVGPIVSAAGAALAGNDAGDAMQGTEGFQDWRARQKYGSPATAATDGVTAAPATGIYAQSPARLGNNAFRTAIGAGQDSALERLKRYVAMNPLDTAAAAQLAQMQAGD